MSHESDDEDASFAPAAFLEDHRYNPASQMEQPIGLRNQAMFCILRLPS